jgi:hypothetical protein
MGVFCFWGRCAILALNKQEPPGATEGFSRPGGVGHYTVIIPQSAAWSSEAAFFVPGGTAPWGGGLSRGPLGCTHVAGNEVIVETAFRKERVC